MSQEIKSWNNGIVEDQAGSTLPTVNADDNGKTLQVVDGQWDKGGKIPDPQLPAPAVGDIGKIVGAVSDGESGAEYGLIDAPVETVIVECTEGSITQEEFAKLAGALNKPNTLIKAKVTAGASVETAFSSHYPYYVDISFESTSTEYWMNAMGYGIVYGNSKVRSVLLQVGGGSGSSQVVASYKDLASLT